MNTSHASRVEIQAKYNKIWTNKFLPNEFELVELNRIAAVKECLRAARKDWVVRIAGLVLIVVMAVIVGC